MRYLGAGFRKIRRALGVTAFAVNAIVMPRRYETTGRYHDRQQETYLGVAPRSRSSSVAGAPRPGLPDASSSAAFWSDPGRILSELWRAGTGPAARGPGAGA